MKQKKLFMMGLMTGVFGMFVFTACSAGSNNSKPKEEPKPTVSDIDKELYNKAKETTGFVWYKNSDVLLPKSAGTGHVQPFLRTRYNAIAAQQLDANGKIKAGAVFADGSLIVKELTNTDKSIGLYAILYKDSKNPNADSKGWVWSYIQPNGDAQTSATAKGVGCNSCHSQTGNIDYMLMNQFFP